MDYHILIPLIPFILGIILKTILDFNLAFFVVKRCHWLPVRWLFRTKPETISGQWTQLWENEISDKYQDKAGRQSALILKQFGKYIYGEFRANNDEEYYVFGEIIGRNIIGKWGDRKNELGYYGAYELRIIDTNNIEGIWLGHSNPQPNIINHNKWTWKR
ncbi:hypothetical protein [Lunatibacter salilacus]|uniref:hypothetical protein n=1 Tax=Lunatibacter salilacus TaxID=2483804 RepID=UPI00131A78F3|nr:hypothetical protein [Lunatibacter salilacus]